jgi:hypothetical protein
MIEGLEIREVEPDDARAIAEVHLTARCDAMPYLQPAHTGGETWDYFGRVVGDRPSAWCIARVGKEIVGYMLIDGKKLDHL